MLNSRGKGEQSMSDKIQEELSFEQAMAELESLVKRLEEGRLPLEEAIASYERGTQLKKYCEQKLQSAKLRVEKIQVTPEGIFKAEPLVA